MIKGEKYDMGKEGQGYGCHWLRNRRDMKGNPLKNNTKHKNEQGKKRPY